MKIMSKQHFYRLINAVKNYPWGSRSELNQRFHVLNPDDQPQAELWMGVHPSGISQVVCKEGTLALSELIARDTTEMLGAVTAERFGELPYLLKILAAEKALSIQVHPDKAAAESGFARTMQMEASDNPDYNDNNHKPELVYAITPFVAMNGFRDLKTIVRNVKILNIAELNDAADILEQQQNDEGLKSFFLRVMQISQTSKNQAINQIVTDGVALYGQSLAEIIQRLNQQYPDDIGVLAPLLLNCITLQPGEAMFLYPGTLHAYLHGTAIEVMASSDNVLRAGLTNKKINLAELISCTKFFPTTPSSLLLAPERSNGCARYPVPVNDFRFSLFTTVINQKVINTSASIVLVIEGHASLKHESGEILELNVGESVFIPASTQIWYASAAGKLCLVSC
jgi:mannose-6-phosphate isomerase